MVCGGEEVLIDASNTDVTVSPESIGTQVLQGSGVEYVQLEDSHSLIVSIRGYDVVVSKSKHPSLNMLIHTYPRGRLKWPSSVRFTAHFSCCLMSALVIYKLRKERDHP